MKHHPDILSPLSAIPGFGPKKMSALKDSELERIEDLLYYFPRKWENKGEPVPIDQLKPESPAYVVGEVSEIRLELGRKSRLRVGISDGTGMLELIWFAGFSYLEKQFKKGRKVAIYGTVKVFHRAQMVHPEIEFSPDPKGPRYPFEPRYPLTQAMGSAKIGHRTLISAMEWIFENLSQYPQNIPSKIEKKYALPPLKEALRQIHFPDNIKDRDYWFRRIIVEELYTTALNLRWNRGHFRLPGRELKDGSLQDAAIEELPFSLTKDQKDVIDKLKSISASPKRMHSLLQGDVGSGKTVTAYLATLPALGSGYQVAWIAPTTVLAEQTYYSLKSWLQNRGVEVKLLTGATSAEDRRRIYKGLTNGELCYVVGTHALLSDKFSFAKLGMVVIDEQHRFGSAQRQALQMKDNRADLLMMSATPIPQSLASTIYSDLDLIEIRSLPSGRIPIKTHLVPTHKEEGLHSFIKARVEASERVYWIVPRITSTEEGDKSLSDIETTAINLEKIHGAKSLGLLHGKIKESEKNSIIHQFAIGEKPLLLATTVVEVGIDVPEATVIVIQNCERFGLSQLHQLRGRVGRGSKQSWCFLLPGNDTTVEAIERLQHFCNSNDGFAIAELDLHLRGAGEVMGDRQSGFSDLRFTDILKEAELFKSIQKDVEELIEEDESGEDLN